MSGKQFRTMTRYIHLGVAILFLVYFYVPSGDSETLFRIIRIIGLPIVGISGIALWQQPRILKFIRR